MIPKLPGHAARVIEAIQAAGGRGYLVGGALRDLLMGALPTDWDFAATLTPTRLMATFPGAKLIGGSCGTVEALFTNSEGDPYGRWHCQITPCRREGGYSDARHPDVVEFVPDILADLARRDFTVNAMAYDGEILLDPFGGQQDIRRRLLRCVGNAEKRFEEDALRVLRLYRFAAQLGFTAQWGTFRAANEAMDKLATLPKQRVLDEMELILASAGPQVLSGVIAMGGLAGYGFHFAPSLAVLAEVPNLPLCRWWALMALCGADVREVCAAFGFSKRFCAQLLAVTALYRAGPSATGTALKQKLRNQKLDYAPLAATFAAVSPAYSAEPAIFAAVCARHEAYRINQLAINGGMLEEEGITGRLCGRVLGQLLDAVIQNPALNKKDVLLGLARGLKLIL